MDSLPQPNSQLDTPSALPAALARDAPRLPITASTSASAPLPATAGGAAQQQQEDMASLHGATMSPASSDAQAASNGARRGTRMTTRATSARGTRKAFGQVEPDNGEQPASMLQGTFETYPQLSSNDVNTASASGALTEGSINGADEAAPRGVKPGVAQNLKRSAEQASEGDASDGKALPKSDGKSNGSSE